MASEGAVSGIRFTPAVINDTGSGSVKMEVNTPAGTTAVVLQLLSGTPAIIGGISGCAGARSISLYDDGTHGDTQANDLTFTIDGISYDAARPVQCSVGYFAASVGGAWNFRLGDLQVTTAGVTATWLSSRFTLMVLTGSAATDLDPVFPVAADMQVSSHVINIVDNAEWLGNALCPPGGFDIRPLVNRIYNLFPDVFDFVGVNSTFHPTACTTVGVYNPVRNDTTGLGTSIFNSTAAYGSKGRLRGVMGLGNQTDVLLMHELQHRWGGYLPSPLALTDGTGHWLSNNNMSSRIGGCAWQSNGNGTFTSLGGINQSRRLGSLTLYLMGLISPAALESTWVAQTSGQQFCTPNTVINGPFTELTLTQIVAAAGTRSPNWQSAPRDFRIGYVVASKGLLTPLEMAYFNRAGRYLMELVPPGQGYNPTFMKELTSGLATIDNAVRAPSAVFRDSFGGIGILANQAAQAPRSNGGVFASDPGSTQESNGDTHVVARDSFNALWWARFSAESQAWSAWRFLGGVVAGNPAMAFSTSGLAYVGVRDAYNSYWLCRYDPSSASPPAWTNLGGVFSTDPVMAADSDGSVYIAGKDQFNAVWSGYWNSAGSFGGWQPGSGVVKGVPSIAVGTDHSAYIAVRDFSDALWIARVSANTWAGWSSGGGVLSADPKLAASASGLIHVALLDPAGGVWYRNRTQGPGGGWQDWHYAQGTLQDASPVSVWGRLFIAGRDSGGDLWWYTPSKWTRVGLGTVATGPFSVSPK